MGKSYEAVGLSTRTVVDKYFKGCQSLIGGATIESIEDEVRRRYEAIYDGSAKSNVLEPGSHHQYRKWGELTYYLRWLFISFNKQLIE